jgi:hypothetical protein
MRVSERGNNEKKRERKKNKAMKFKMENRYK